MKIKSLFLAVLLVTGAAVSFAGKDEPNANGFTVVAVKGSEVYKVIYKSEKVGNVRLNIYNQDNNKILSQVINRVDGFICPVNFSGLPSGVYTIEVIDAAGQRSTEKVTYGAAQSAKLFHVARVKGDASKFILSVKNAGAENITLHIYDAQNNLLFTEIKSVDGDFAQVYKITNPSSGYTFEISDSNGVTRTVRF